MKARILSNRLLDTASALALTAVATLGSSAVQPAAAAQGIYGGGATLVSLAMRQIFDCYHGSILPGDGYTISSAFNYLTPTPGLLPTTCTVGALPGITGLYASVGSGSGLRGFISNEPRNFMQSAITTITTPTTLPLPNVSPVYLDGTKAAPFGLYPYPELDFGASEAPLANVVASSLTTVSYSNFTPTTNWQNLLPTITTVAAGASATANYSSASNGAPIQIPALEVPVAIAINVATTTAATWTIRSALTPTTKAGSAIQLSAAQICAIFSAKVRTWNSAAAIAALTTSTTGVASVTSQLFDADNTNATVHTALPYTNTALPIRVAYRSDGSGTTFVMTNYLASVCPLLDNGTNNYKKIFTGVGRTTGATANLPGTSFATLIDNIKVVTGVDVLAGTSPWIGASGNASVAANISNSSSGSGRIGYLSADFTQPYATTVTGVVSGTTVTVPAPRSASVQNENLRANRVNHPGDTGAFATAQNFIAPTPDNASNAWKQLKAPTATTATFNNWNIYTQAFTSGSSGGLALTGKLILPLATSVAAYPISGTTFLELYSCYRDTTATRVPAIRNFLSWFIGGSNSGLPVGTPSTSTGASPKYDADVGRIMRNNGFHELPAAFSTAIIAQFVKPSASGGSTKAIAAFKTAGAQVDGCIGVTGGGAK